MSPAIKTGSAVFIQKAPSYQKGEVIAFKPENSKNLVTHRIVSVGDTPDVKSGSTTSSHIGSGTGESGPTFQTKGDANEEADPWQVNQDKVAGKVILYIPGLGFGVDFVKKPQGFVLLVIIPASIIIWEELKVLLGEAGKIISGLFFRKHRKVSPSAYVIPAPSSVIPAKAGIQLNNQGWILDQVENDRRVGDDRGGRDDISGSHSGSPKLMIFIPLVGFFLVAVAVSGAYFLDVDKSLGNVLGAASSFATPEPIVSPQEATESASPSAQPSP